MSEDLNKNSETSLYSSMGTVQAKYITDMTAMCVMSANNVSPLVSIPTLKLSCCTRQ